MKFDVDGTPWNMGTIDCAGVFCAYVNGTANVTISQSRTIVTAAGGSCAPPNIMPKDLAEPINDFIIGTVNQYLPQISKNSPTPKAVALALNFHGQKGRVMLCSTDNCNNQSNTHYEETESLMTSIEKATESFGQISQDLKCMISNGDNEASIDCKGGFCMMGRTIGNTTINYKGCFNKMPDGIAPITQAYASIKLFEAVLQNSKNTVAKSGIEKLASDVADAGQGLLGGIVSAGKVVGIPDYGLGDAISSVKRKEEKPVEIPKFEFGVNELRGVTGDSGIAAATIYLNDTKIIFIGAYCSADNCNSKESALAKSFDTIQSDFENASGSLFGSCLAIMTVVVLVLVDL